MVMEPYDYRRHHLFEDGLLKGIALSVPIHLAAILAALVVSQLTPPPDGSIPVCTVRLLSSSASGGGKPSAGIMKREDQERNFSPLVEPTAKKEKAEKHPQKPIAASRPAKKKAPVAAPPPPLPPSTSLETQITPSEPSIYSSTGDLKGASVGESGDSSQNGSPTTYSRSDSGSGNTDGIGGNTMGFGDNADDPAFLVKILPQYPWMARKLGKEGTVLLLIAICERGRLIDAQIIERAGFGFDEEALTAVKKSTFRPAHKNGRPVPCKALLPIVFKLKSPL